MGDFSVDFDFIQNNNYSFTSNNMDFFPCVLTNPYFNEKYMGLTIDWDGDYDLEKNLEIVTFETK